MTRSPLVILRHVVPRDVAADILLRGVEEGSITRAQALNEANECGILFDVRSRLDALVAFTRPCPICGDPAGERACETTLCRP